MKKQLKLINLFAIVLLFTTFGCNNDDDVNNNRITLQDFTATIDENPTNGQSLGTVQTDGQGTLSFSITTQSPAGAITINISSGEVSVADAALFDFESNSTITATIAVAGAENTAAVTINLNDLNEIGVQDLTSTIDENPTNGQSIGIVQVNGNGPFSFSIDAQSPSGALDISTSTGELTVANAALFDFETNPTVTGTIAVVGAESTATFTINLNNLVEISADDFTVAIDENPTDGQIVGSIQVNGGGNLSFSITSQTPASALTINASTGELAVADPTLFDFETNPVITATISVDDIADTTMAIATINLNDVDEITVQDLNTSIDENPSTGATIGTLQATAGGSLTYTITFQNPAGAFNIDQNTGELSVADETLFDFEINPNMLATISVDNGVSSVSANAFVGTNDVNELGEFKYGGVIFWIDPSSNNSSGLVSAITDQGTNVSWGCQGTFISGTSTAIGSGASNTATILAGCSTSGIAADIASNTTIDSYSDWFLPSRSELNQMYLQKAIINTTAIANGGTAFIDSNLSTRYWSSSESNGNTAWCKYFATGIDAGLNKGAGAFFQARVVRAWTDF